MKYISWLISLLLLLNITACKNKGSHPGEEVQQAPAIKLTIHRYEKDLFSIDQKKLRTEVTRLMPEYPFFLGTTPPDTASLLRLSDYLKDTLIQAIYRETMKAYPNLDSVEKELGQAFANLEKVFPETDMPKVYTYISGIDYENPVRMADSVVIIALDMYLGENCRFYPQAGIPQFRYQMFHRVTIVPDVIKEMIFSKMHSGKQDKDLLEWMVFYGKMLVALDYVLPDLPDYRKIGYLPEQLQWCRDNESKIWGYFISNKLLFTTDSRQIMNFIPDAPFTKGMSKESPGRLGWWLGWQIVRKYMEDNPSVSLPQLLQIEDAQLILNQSGYKPGK